jgi:hypothetical protein
VGVSKVGRISVHNTLDGRTDGKCTFTTDEVSMPAAAPTDREALARELAQLLRDQSEETFLQIAQLLTQADDSQLFGTLEFKIRDLLLQLGTRAYNLHLQQKKTATTAPVSPAPTASRPPASRTTAPDAP